MGQVIDLFERAKFFRGASSPSQKKRALDVCWMALNNGDEWRATREEAKELFSALEKAEDLIFESSTTEKEWRNSIVQLSCLSLNLLNKLEESRRLITSV